MQFKELFLTPIRGYQYISRMLPANCRYYPTCSEYAKWQFQFNTPHKAFVSTTLRILRCNQLFAGGIDYPVVYFQPLKTAKSLGINDFCGKIDINYWLVPKDPKQSLYYVIKDFHANTTSHTP